MVGRRVYLPWWVGGYTTLYICLSCTVSRESPSCLPAVVLARPLGTHRVDVRVYTFSHRVEKERLLSKGNLSLSPQEITSFWAETGGF